jgi:hypothetical protein
MNVLEYEYVFQNFLPVQISDDTLINIKPEMTKG